MTEAEAKAIARRLNEGRQLGEPIAVAAPTDWPDYKVWDVGPVVLNLPERNDYNEVVEEDSAQRERLCTVAQRWNEIDDNWNEIENLLEARA